MKDVIADLLLRHLKDARLKKEELQNLIEIPPDSSFGDYAFPCFVLAKQLKKAPADISTELAREINEKLNTKKISEISGVEARGPYLNFFINKKIFAEKIIKEILKEKENFGKSEEEGNKKGKEKGKEKDKILIEHTSLNPNSSPHVGRIRNSLIGDSIKRLFEFRDFKTETHFYVNDVSKQVALLCLSDKINKFSGLLSEYIRLSKQVEKSKETEKKVFELLNKFESGNKETVKKFRRIVDIAIKGQKKILENIGIEFNFFDYESDFLKEAKGILDALEKTGKLFKDEQGRYVLDQSGTSIEKKMKAPYLVLTRSDGTGLYPLRDLAYTIWKSKRAKDSIIVLGEDQKLYFEQLKIALEFLKQKTPKVIHYSYVLIQTPSGKEKMSTRRGDLVLFEDFFNEAIKKAQKEIKKRETKGDAKKIAIAAVKYAILKNNADRNIVFNLDEALNFEGDTGPYLQYSYARASSILRKGKIKEIKKSIKVGALEASEIELIKSLGKFPEIISSAYKQFSPNLIANYAYEIAKLFSEFYHSCPVLSSDKEQQAQRIAVVQAFRIVMKNALWILGIEAIDEM